MTRDTWEPWVRNGVSIMNISMPIYHVFAGPRRDTLEFGITISLKVSYIDQVNKTDECARIAAFISNTYKSLTQRHQAYTQYVL